MEKLLKTYLKRLTNLTSRNRSLLLLKLPKRHFFDLHELNFSLNQPSFSVIEQLMEQKSLVPLVDFLDPRNERTNEQSKQLSLVERTQKTIEEERGVNDLYVGYPIVQGKFMDGTLVRCPLLFFPVTLCTETVQKNTKWCLKKRDAELVFNRSFLLAYSYFNQQKISDEWLDFSFEDFPKNSLEFRTKLYELLKNSPLEINFNQELFQDKLIDFKEFTKKEAEENEHTGELKLYPQAVLGIFPETGSYLANDYTELLKEKEQIPADFDVLFEVQTSNPTTLLKEENLLLPLAVDASQENAIRAIKKGQSMVVQGPPGTGKSQLIANLIADFTASGKRVLVVCQKRAALDTVFERLAKIGLENFLALVHDFKNDRKELFEKIANQIEAIEQVEQKNKGLDTIFLEHEFHTTARQIDAISWQLDDLKTALFDEKIAGKAIKELYIEIYQLSKKYNIDTYLPLTTYYTSFRLTTLDSFLQKTTYLERYQNVLESNENTATRFWKNRRSAHQWKGNDKSTVLAYITEINSWKKTLEKETLSLLNQALSMNELTEKLKNNLLIINNLINNKEIFDFYFQLINNKKNQQEKVTKNGLKSAQKEIIFLLENGGILPHFLTQPNHELCEIICKEALENSDNFIKKKWWLLTSKNSAFFKNYLLKNKLRFEENELRLYLQKVQNTKQFQKLQNEFKNNEIVLPFSLEKALETIENIQVALDASHVDNSVLWHSSLFFDSSNWTDFQAKTTQLIDWANLQNGYLEKWRSYFTETQIHEINDSNSEQLQRYLATHFDTLIEADQLFDSCSETEKKVIEIAEKELKNISLSSFIQVSLYHHWANHIEEEYPILKSVSTLKIRQLEEELQALILKKETLCKAIVLLKLQENTYKKIEKNRLGNTITYRELHHQVTKKKQRWAVRKVVEKFSSEIFQLLPCWLASPETVAAVFPILPIQCFDLVIFDEASQCFAEHGVPSLFRAKQVVVAGDSQQLRPNDLYNLRYEEENDENESLEEIDALLDLAARSLPSVQLRGHYRSKSLDLIAFSNQYFYKNKLDLLPDYQYINKNKSSFYYIKTNGTWLANSNEEEARKVVEIVAELPPEKSIGVVTFNARQAEKIMNLMGSSRQNVKVKNIENIQGDEFDVVVFSVGYAANKTGKVAAHFGSLNVEGGENRLNVAITRAREAIYVVTSIFPDELQVETTQNDGPKLLKKFLKFALSVSEGKFVSHQQPPEMRFKTLLKDILLDEEPLNTTTELPFADITLKNDDATYKSLIFTDDDLYFNSLSGKHTHGYLPLLLRQKGWKFERRWTRNLLIKS